MGTVVARAPLRISLGGGGTDLPSWSKRHGGFVVSAAIDKHVHLLASTWFRSGLLLKHLDWETPKAADDVRHPILRAALARHWSGAPLELATLGDVPPGSGLGSSGAYAVCVVKALRLIRQRDVAAGQLAEDACTIEIGDLGLSVGKQDQHVAAHGGIAAYTFRVDGSVEREPLALADRMRAELDERFLLFYSGETRSASALLARQVPDDPAVERNLRRGMELARVARDALLGGRADELGELLNEQWENRVERVPAVATPRVVELRQTALRAGATGAALMGAGGGGFLLAYAPEPAPVRQAMAATGATELPFTLEDTGCTATSPR